MFRKIISEEIKSQEIRRKDLCLATSITKSILSNFLRGNASISMKHLEAILKYLNIELAKVTDNSKSIKLYTYEEESN